MAVGFTLVVGAPGWQLAVCAKSVQYARMFEVLLQSTSDEMTTTTTVHRAEAERALRRGSRMAAAHISILYSQTRVSAGFCRRRLSHDF